MTPQELFTKSLMTYDRSDGSHDLFYYNLPYIRNYDLCNWKPHGLYSGNIVKFYQYNLDKPVILFTDTEEETPTSEPTEFSGQEELSDTGIESAEDIEGLTPDEIENLETFADEENATGEFQSFTDSDLENVNA